MFTFSFSEVEFSSNWFSLVSSSLDFTPPLVRTEYVIGPKLVLTMKFPVSAHALYFLMLGDVTHFYSLGGLLVNVRGLISSCL